ncbi:MAG: glycosyltransferase family 4 protein [Planctomycetes bacterium]|nr:glycosyltransferase family 4 protein [Planctomycetota bacterium]
MRVLMLCPFAKPNVGGVESHLAKLLDIAARRGIRITLVTYQPLTTPVRGAARERIGPHEIERLDWFGHGWFPVLERFAPAAFAYLFPGIFAAGLAVLARARGRFDCIHAHGLAAAGAARILSQIYGIRSVASTHAVYRLGERPALARALRSLLGGFDRILAVGKPSLDELIGIGLDPSRIAIHPNWVDLDLFRPLPRERCRARLGIPPDAFAVLYLGRLLEKKGARILADAIGRTGSDRLRLIIIGDGPLAPDLARAAAADARIRFIGRIPHGGIDRIIEAYNAADLFASPVTYEEGFASVYLEAVACGTPVLTAPRGCLPSFLDERVAIWTESTPEAVARALADLSAFRRPLPARDACRRHAEEYFGERNAEVILGAYGSPDAGRRKRAASASMPRKATLATTRA